MTVTLCVLEKKTNSTRQPDLSLGTQVSCVLKEPCTILRPSLFFQNWNADPATINYCYIEEFHRYYWVSNWEWNRAGWTCDCFVDALASWKDAIGGSTEYILRCSAEADGRVTDNWYPIVGQVTNTYNNITPGLWPAPLTLSAGSYVVGIINGDGNGVGAVSYYVMTQSQFDGLKSYLFGQTQWYREPGQDTITPSGLYNLKSQFNPFAYVVSAQWFPFSAPTSGAVGNLPFGWWSMNGVSASRLDTQAYWVKTASVSVSKHPQSAARGVYLNMAPYSQYVLTAEPWGQIPIDSAWLLNESSINLQVVVDCTTGIGQLYIYSPQESPEQPYLILSAMLGVPVQIAQMSQDWLGAGLAVLRGAQGVLEAALSGGQSASGFSKESTISTQGKIQMGRSVTGALGNAAGAIMPEMVSGGSQGSLISFFNTPSLRGKFAHITNTDDATCGRPLCALRQISSISGFIQTLNADVSIQGTYAESVEINNTMNEGFFYE